MVGEKKPLVDEDKLVDILGDQFTNGSLQVKNLGPQISWRTVFLVEYVGVSAPIPSLSVRLTFGGVWSPRHPSAHLPLPSSLVWQKCAAQRTTKVVFILCSRLKIGNSFLTQICLCFCDATLRKARAGNYLVSRHKSIASRQSDFRGSVHRFSNDTMPWFNIFKKYVVPPNKSGLL